jgi:hypothetical protein
VKRERDILPVVLFELSVMRDTVRRFDRLGERDAPRLLSRLTILESKARRLIDLQTPRPHSRRDH